MRFPIPGLVITLASVTSAAAEVDSKSGLDTYALPEIVVTAKSLQGSSNLGREVDVESIEVWNAHTAAEVLVQTPGVNVQYGGSSGDARIWMRGFRDRDILVLFDGIPIATAFEGNIDLNEISMEAITNVRVTKGAPSVIYGPNGMGGVVDIVPAPNSWDDSLSLSVEGGADDAQRINGGYAGRTEKLQYRVSGSYDHRDSFRLADDFQRDVNQTGSTRTNADFRRETFFGHLSADNAILGNTSIFYNISNNERGLAPEVGEVDADFERLTQSDRKTIGISNQFESIPLSIKLFHNHYDSELSVYTDNTYEEIDEIEDAEENSYGAMAYSSLSAGNTHTFVVSAMALDEEFESEGTLDGFDDASLETFSLAVEDHISVGRTSVVAGGVYSRFEQSENDRSIEVFTPQATFDWRVTDALALHASVAQRTRFPKLRELYQRRRGNPSLKEQTAENYQLGLAFSHGASWLTDLTLFHSDVHDLIERPDRTSSYQNLPDVEFEGIEVASGGWLSERVYGRLAYTFLDATERTASGHERQLRSRAKHTVYGEVRIDLGYGTRLSMNGIFSDGLHDLDSDQMHVELPSAFVMQAKLSKQIGKYFQSYISIANATDTDYEHRLGYPRPGRDVRVGFAVRI